MARVFLTFIGSGGYDPVTYTLDGQSDRNHFVSKAILNMLSAQGKQFDRMIFFLTDTARANNWEKASHRNKQTNTITPVEGLQPYLESHFPGKFEPVWIPECSNESDLTKLFKIIYDNIGEGDSITFETTHGYRLLPLLFFPVMRYAKELKHISIDHIYYGLYTNGAAEAPVVDLLVYDEILDCANAAHLFIRSGNASEIKEVVNARMDRLIGGEKQTFSGARDVVKLMKKLNTALLTCQGGANNCSIQPLSASLVQNENKLNTVTAPEAVFFNAMISHAIQSVHPFLECTDPVQQGLCAVEWYLERGLIVQGYTALRETITTLMCVTYAPGEDFLLPDFRTVIDYAMNECVSHGEEKPTVEKGMQNAVSAQREHPECVLPIVKLVQHVDFEKLRFIPEIVIFRNCMNHFGMRKDNQIIDEAKLRKDLQLVQDLISDIDARRADILTDEQAQEKLDAFLAGQTGSGVFVNFSNHPSDKWSAEQRSAALALASVQKIEDVPFPQVSAEASETDITGLAVKYAQEIAEMRPAVVMCMGETGLCFEMVNRLKSKSIRVVYTTTEREASEHVTEQSAVKTSVFRFVRFRDY
ncbi:MAG: TM1812 family CRISPR-associated protein [Oscillospiraceae bacterium]|nr:TM1812 family CRISPR-associated protein [Oscillospiraceae bacterium]